MSASSQTVPSVLDEEMPFGTAAGEATMVRREALPTDAQERLVLCVFRFVHAAYDTGDSACSEAAHAQAEAVRGLLDGALLVARVTAVVRLIRARRPGFQIRPPSCRWLSHDEIVLMRLVRGARFEGAALFVDAPADRLLASAIGGLLAWDPAPPRAAGPRLPSHGPRDTRSVLSHAAAR